MTWQNNVYLSTVLLEKIIANSERTHGSKFSLLVLVTRLCMVFLSDEQFSQFDRVYVAPEQISKVYNSCLYSVWTLIVLPEDVLIESSSEEQMEEDDESEFLRQPPPTDSNTFTSTIWKDIKKIFMG